MVKNLPYFHVWFDPNRGYGHIIEESSDWPAWFGNEVLAGPLDLAPDLWRKPKRIADELVAGRLRSFLKSWSSFDWTVMLNG